VSENQVRVALATKHGKLEQIAPVFLEQLNWQVELVEFDTDVYGTFSGEIDRAKSPRETVIDKALEAARVSGLHFALASEGSIGSHPGFPFVTSDFELMAFVDTDRNLHIVESHLSPKIVAVKEVWSEEVDVEDFSRRADLPNHAVIVKSPDLSFISKGLRNTEEISEASRQCLEQTGLQAIVESDFRAMCSPSRQENIRACALKLANRLATNCPGCDYFGFGFVDYERGLACSDCGLMNVSAPRAEVLGCVACDYRELKDLGRETIPADRCQNCNP